MVKNLSNKIPVTISSLVLLGIIILTTNETLINIVGYFVGSLLSPFIIISLISRMTHWDNGQKLLRIIILDIVFQLLFLLPLESPRSLISLISVIAFIGLIIAIVIESFHKKVGKK